MLSIFRVLSVNTVHLKDSKLHVSNQTALVQKKHICRSLIQFDRPSPQSGGCAPDGCPDSVSLLWQADHYLCQPLGHDAASCDNDSTKWIRFRKHYFPFSVTTLSFKHCHTNNGLSNNRESCARFLARMLVVHDHGQNRMLGANEVGTWN